jgi:DNA-binding MarR family transcriptional regulator
VDEDVWLTEQQQEAWITFVNASSMLDRVLDQQLRADAGLSHVQYGILAHLEQAPGGALRMLPLAESMAITKSGLSYQIAQLEKQGLVCRRACPSDDRGVVASLTDLGREKMRQAAPGHVALVRDLVFDALSPQQLAALVEGMAEIQRRILDRT